MKRISFSFLCLYLFFNISFISTKRVRIHNNIPRRDLDENIIDCHSGNIVHVGSTFYMYGEYYGNNTGFNETSFPQLYVYTSKDLTHWINHGPMFRNAPPGTYFTPFGVYNPKTEMFVVWFNAYIHGCCNGNFGVAQSKDGIHFEIVSLNVTGYYSEVDCNGLFVDDDGTGYVIYSSVTQDHSVSFEKLTPDFLHSTHENYGLFPDHYVEGPVLFKRNGLYYVIYGSCCCFCRGGSGVIVYAAPTIKGPWQQLGYDINCNTNSTYICGAYGERVTQDPLIIQAQGIGLSLINTTQGIVYLWTGERWLSAPHNNPNCPDECRPETGICEEPPNYIKGHGFSYWIPLEFNSDGSIATFQPFVDSFTLDIE